MEGGARVRIMLGWGWYSNKGDARVRGTRVRVSLEGGYEDWPSEIVRKSMG